MKFGLRRRDKVLSIAVALALLPSLAWAAGNSARGHTLARIWCSSCHVVDSKGNRSEGTAKDVAPPFSDIAARSAPGQVEARAFLVAPHPPMPNFDLAREQIDDIVAYLNSLAAH